MKIQFGGLRQHGSVEDRFEIAIAFDANAGSTLELSFREFRFDQKISDAEVYLGSLHVICEQGYSGLTPELKALRRFCAEQSAEETTGRKSLWVAEDIHEERVRTCGRVQFPSLRVMTYQAAPRGGVRLRESATPFGSSANAFVRCRVKVSMSPILGLAE
jgi:hypothetical protein